jgi:hypothetical protein
MGIDETDLVFGTNRPLPIWGMEIASMRDCAAQEQRHH